MIGSVVCSIAILAGYRISPESGKIYNYNNIRQNSFVQLKNRGKITNTHFKEQAHFK